MPWSKHDSFKDRRNAQCTLDTDLSLNEPIAYESLGTLCTLSSFISSPSSAPCVLTSFDLVCRNNFLFFVDIESRWEQLSSSRQLYSRFFSIHFIRNGSQCQRDGGQGLSLPSVLTSNTVVVTAPAAAMNEDKEDPGTTAEMLHDNITPAQLSGQMEEASKSSKDLSNLGCVDDMKPES